MKSEIFLDNVSSDRLVWHGEYGDDILPVEVD